MATTGNRGRRLAERQGPEEFFNAAVKILGELGHEGLTINRLCTRLGVTKGSFYHHFADFDAFVEQLLSAWAGTTQRYIEEVVALGDPVRQFDAVMVAWSNMPHEAEGAIRAWARSNPRVAAAVRHRDALAIEVSAAWLGQWVDDPERRRVLSHMGTSMVAGMQAHPGPIDRELFVDACVEFVRLATGLHIRKESGPNGPKFTVVTST